LRILHVNKFLYRRGGAEAYMEDAAALAREAGHEVGFFGMQHPENTHNELARHFPPYIEFDDPPAGRLEQARTAARMVWSVSALRGMQGAVAEFQPDVVHLHNIYHHLSPSILRPLARLGIPAVMTLHDYKLACPSYLFMDKGQPCEACLGGKFGQAIRRRCKGGSLASSALLAGELAIHTQLGAYSPVDVFICPSRFILGKMQAAGVFPDRLRLLHHFVDASSGSGPAVRRPHGPVLFVGRLSQEKGPDLLVDAASRVPAGHQIVIAGDGPMREQLEQRAEQVAPGRVTFLGRVSKQRVTELMSEAAALVAPSRCYENQPLGVLEALAAGVPVVGAALGGIAEIVDDGVFGSLFPAGDAAALGAALAGLLEDPDRAARMGRLGREAVTADYSAQVHLQGLERLYAEASARHGASLVEAAR
jgi:glycosyltransferase involved in cell wall biosynthesis